MKNESKTTNRRNGTRGAETRHRVLETARALLTDQGLESFALRDIAKRANMQLGNLQYYFPSREDLIEAVIVAELDANLDFMDALAENADDLEDYVRRLVLLMIDEYTGLGGKVWPVLRLLRTHNPRFRTVSREVYRRHFKSIVDAMRRHGSRAQQRELLQQVRLITVLIDGAATQAHLWTHAGASPSFRALCQQTADLAVAIATQRERAGRSSRKTRQAPRS